METIITDTENSRTNEVHTFKLNLPDVSILKTLIKTLL